MTYRERRLARADRLRGWAEKHHSAAEAVFESHKPYTTDIAFNTQPGHIPFRARIIAQEDRAYESMTKARSMASRADSMEAQAENAIYSDDPDAVERLRERIADLEAERDRIKAFNVSCRKGMRDLSLLDERQRARYESIAQVAKFQLGRGGSFPGYALTNLSGNIARNRQRLEGLTR